MGQQGSMRVMGHNSISPLRTSSQGPKLWWTGNVNGQKLRVKGLGVRVWKCESQIITKSVEVFGSTECARGI